MCLNSNTKMAIVGSCQRVMCMLLLACPLFSVDGFAVAYLPSLRSARMGGVFRPATCVRSTCVRSPALCAWDHGEQDDKAIYRALHQVGGGMFYKGVRGRR